MALEGTTVPGEDTNLSLLCSLLGGKQLSKYRMILGPQQPSHPLELLSGEHSTDFYVEGLAFPDANFPGLISLTISLLDTSHPVGQRGGEEVPGLPGRGPTGGGCRAQQGRDGRCWVLASVTAPPLPLSLQELPNALVFQDSIAFRVAPWIMTPNTQPPKEVYVCR